MDTWDVYEGGHTKLTLNDSGIDELIASEHANLTVIKSNVYADWLGVNDDASMAIENSRVGALRFAAKRPDLATSQVRVTGRGRASFKEVRFDFGVLAEYDSMCRSSSLSSFRYIQGHRGTR